MLRFTVLGALLTSVAVADEPEIPWALAEVEADGLRAIETPVHWPTQSLVISGGTVLTAAGDVFTPGYVVVRGGHITAVGEGEAPEVEDAEQIDATGRYITPGLIDTHSHLGVYPSPWARAHSDGNEATSPTTPGVWAEHSFWPQDPGLQRAAEGGITSLQALPGSANLVGGRGVVLHMTPARGGRAMRFPGAPETLKMACGENPKRVYENSGPSTRMGNVRGQRRVFLDAAEGMEEWQEYSESLAAFREFEELSDKDKAKARRRGEAPEEPDMPGRDLDQETLIGLLHGDIYAQIHCYRADDMLSMMQMSDEFGFKIRSFHHAIEAYKIRDLLVEHDISASTWADWWGFKLEAYDAVQANAAMLHDAGGRAIIHSDSEIGIQRLNQEAAKAMRAGIAAGIELSTDDVLRWVTANPAWAIGIDDQVGTLEVGKRADLVIWDAHPLSVYAHADNVFVDGHLIIDREQPQTWSDFEIGQGVH